DAYDLPGRGAARRGAAARAGSRDGEALRLRDGRARDGRGRAHLRLLRPRDGVPDPALLPRRALPAAGRWDAGDPARGDRPRPRLGPRRDIADAGAWTLLG